MWNATLLERTSASTSKDCFTVVTIYIAKTMDTNNRLRAIWHGLTRCDRNKQFVVSQDLNGFDKRLVNEGAEFYARALTTLRTALLTGLETGVFVIPANLFKQRKGTRLPTWLYLAFSAIFTDDGLVRDIVNVDAVSCLNQLLAVFGKIEGGHTKSSEATCLDNFVKTELEVARWSRMLDDVADYQRGGLAHPGEKGNEGDNALRDFLQTYPQRCTSSQFLFAEYGIESDAALTLSETCFKIDMARKLVARVLCGVDPSQLESPKHGSGKSACNTPVRWRYGKPRFVEAIHRVWPYDEYFFLSPAHLCDVMPGREDVPGSPATHQWLDSLESYIPCAEVLLVPKDARGPRLISCEPRETMWIQQGVLTKVVPWLESHPLTQGLVNFTDQSINKYLAFLGSISRESASLDLKDASDRVSMGLVRCLFPLNWVEALEACRSATTKLPDGTLVELSKHAPMGSALCFPVMALAIWALLTATTNTSQVAKAIKDSGQLRLSRERFQWRNPVYVYGDDIIVSSVFADASIRVLESVGLKVNTNKSFVHSLFRESCGGEYYNGWDVTPVRLRTLPDDDVPSRMKVIAFHNNLFGRYHFQPTWLSELIHDWYPNVPERSFGTDFGKCDVEFVSKRDTPRILHPGFALSATQLRPVQSSLSCVLDVLQPDNRHLPRRYRKRFCRYEYRYLAVVPEGENYPTDRWSQVFRAVVNPRHVTKLGWDALSKRVAYKYRWAPLH